MSFSHNKNSLVTRQAYDEGPRQRPGRPTRIAIGVFAAAVVILSTVVGWSDSTTAVADTTPPKDAGAAAAAVVRPFLAGDAGLYRDRVVYRRAAYAARTGRRTEFDSELAKLDGYPLRPYLLYFDARRRLSRIGEDRASELRAELAGTPLEETFPARMAGHAGGAWPVVDLRPSTTNLPTTSLADVTTRAPSIERATAARRLPEFATLWVVPQSQPEECDPVFNSWISAGGLDQEMVWTRLLLALEANETRLARYLLRFFDRANANAGRLCYDVHLKPETVRSLSRFADTESGRRALRHGLIRYAKREPDKALELWGTVERTYAFAEGERAAIREHLTVVAAGMGLVPQDGPIGYSAADRQQVAQGLVLNRRWAEATLWITALPPDVATETEWRYWLGRALIDSGEEPSTGRQHLRAIAGLPTWYGLLAAGDLGSPPGVPEDPSRHDPRAWHELLVFPAVRRMVELLAADDLVNARREWQYALPKLEPHQRLDLVELTAALGWVDQAIAGAWDADLKEVTRIRYPTPHLDAFRHGAFSANLPMSLLLAISRRESAFNPRARSPAGARGLMQLMPATARGVADRIRDRRPSTEDLLRPDTSVRLGAHHLAGLMSRYDGHRVLAIAAYNAGESRIDRWLKDASGMPTAVWVERIPFRGDACLRQERARRGHHLRPTHRYPRTDARAQGARHSVIDIGVNLASTDFDADRPDVLQRARSAGVTTLIATGTSVESSRASAALAAGYAGGSHSCTPRQVCIRITPGTSARTGPRRSRRLPSRRMSWRSARPGWTSIVTSRHATHNATCSDARSSWPSRRASRCSCTIATRQARRARSSRTTSTSWWIASFTASPATRPI